MEKEKKYIVKESVLITVLNYLGTKPYNESSELISSIRNTVEEYIAPPVVPAVTEPATSQNEEKQVITE